MADRLQGRHDALIRLAVRRPQGFDLHTTIRPEPAGLHKAIRGSSGDPVTVEADMSPCQRFDDVPNNEILMAS